MKSPIYSPQKLARPAVSGNGTFRAQSVKVALGKIILASFAFFVRSIKNFKSGHRRHPARRGRLEQTINVVSLVLGLSPVLMRKVFAPTHFNYGPLVRVTICAAAQRACSAINGSGSCAALSKAGRADGSPAFPSATQTFRSRPRRFVRTIGVPANLALKPAASSWSSSIKLGDCKSPRMCGFIKLPSRANRFQGQAARQSSQP